MREKELLDFCLFEFHSFPFDTALMCWNITHRINCDSICYHDLKCAQKRERERELTYSLLIPGISVLFALVSQFIFFFIYAIFYYFFYIYFLNFVCFLIFTMLCWFLIYNIMNCHNYTHTTSFPSHHPTTLAGLSLTSYSVHSIYMMV